MVTWALHICLEMLPISSSTHADIIGKYLPAFAINDTQAAHGPTAIVFLLYIAPFIVTLLLKAEWQRIWRWMVAGVIADAVTSGIYVLLLYAGSDVIPPEIGMATTGVLLIFVANTVYRKNNVDDPTYSGSLWVGLSQGIALLPGVSRLGMTYAVARLQGWSHSCTFLFSCALVVPLYATYWLVLSGGSIHVPSMVDSVLMCVILTAAYGLLWVTDYLLATGRSWCFGLYMLVIACVIWMFGINITV